MAFQYSIYCTGVPSRIKSMNTNSPSGTITLESGDASIKIENNLQNLVKHQLRKIATILLTIK